MENSKASALDFFLHLGAMVSLYAVTISFLNLVFKIVNKAFPEVAQNYYAWGAGSEISLPVATLIVVFPIFIVLSRFIYKGYLQNPEKKSLSVRKWLTYITLFVAGIILAGDLVTVLYRFLDGQDLTAAFLLKALATLLVTGGIFGYYLQDIRDRVSSPRRRIWVMGAGVIILIAIVAGFAVLGSPKTQRLLRYDSQKLTDLQNLQWQVINHWQIYGTVPDALPSQVNDKQTGNPYEYRKTGEMSFELCADFNRSYDEAELMRQYSEVYPPVGYPAKTGTAQMNDWSHQAGRQCFERVIDPIIYPTQIRG